MTDKPEIKVGQRWVTESGAVVRILATNADGHAPIVGQYEKADADLFQAFGAWGRDGYSFSKGREDLISLARPTVKRQVALYRWKDEPEGAEPKSTEPFAKDMLGPGHPRMLRVSEIVSIEFTLLPGESAE